jgi:hypothetical protein
MQMPPAEFARVVMVVPVLRRYTLIGAAAALALVTPNLDASTTQGVQGATPLPKELQQTQKDFRDDVPAHISVVDGQAELEHDGKIERAEANMLLLAGDRLRTTRGRLEVLFDDGSALHLDENSTVDLLSESLIRLRMGRLRLLVARTSNPIEYRIDAAAGSALIRSAGEYRLHVADGRTSDFELRVVVLRGMAEVTNDSGRTTVRTGSEVFASANRAPSPPYSINSAMTDSFERWAQDQIDARLSVESARYLPEDVRNDAGVFDTYGSWGYESSYGGYVWYPSVAYNWRPYYYGNWRYYGHYGWTWHGYDRWSWATHHYGRWGYSNKWYWVPYAGWGPAWVGWGYAPGYVSWCPLGYTGRPVFGFSVSIGWGSSIYGGPIYGPGHAWTVVPARAFAPTVTPHVAVAQQAVPVGNLAPAVRTQFAEARRTPSAPALAVSRAEPLRAPTGPRAVPRGTATGAPGAALSGSSTGASPAGARYASPGSAAERRTASPRDAGVPRSAVTMNPDQADPPGGSESRAVERTAPSRAVTSSAPSRVPTARPPQSERVMAPRSSVPAVSENPVDTREPASSVRPATSRQRIEPTERIDRTETRPSRSYSSPSSPRSVEPATASPGRAPAAPRSSIDTGGPRSAPSSQPAAQPSSQSSAPASAPSRVAPSNRSGGSSSPPASAAPSRSSGGSGSSGAAASRTGRGGGR